MEQHSHVASDRQPEWQPGSLLLAGLAISIMSSLVYPFAGGSAFSWIATIVPILMLPWCGRLADPERLLLAGIAALCVTSLTYSILTPSEHPLAVFLLAGTAIGMLLHRVLVAHAQAFVRWSGAAVVTLSGFIALQIWVLGVSPDAILLSSRNGLITLLLPLLVYSFVGWYSHGLGKDRIGRLNVILGFAVVCAIMALATGRMGLIVTGLLLVSLLTVGWWRQSLAGGGILIGISSLAPGEGATRSVFALSPLSPEHTALARLSEVGLEADVRQDIWREILPQFWDLGFVLGFPDEYVLEKTGYSQPHNGYIEILVGLGSLGATLVVLAIAVGAIYLGRRAFALLPMYAALAVRALSDVSLTKPLYLSAMVFCVLCARNLGQRPSWSSRA